MDTLFQQIIGLLLFVGIQYLVYKIYHHTNKTMLALIPNFVLLGLTILVSISLILFTKPGSVWSLVIVYLIIFMIIGVGFSTFVSWVMIYLIKQRKNQPIKK
jgi:hypothetical protein